MKFLVDAQLPVRLADGLPKPVTTPSILRAGQRQSDDRRRDHLRADDEDRVVVTKDRDFRDSHLLRSVPRRLLVVATDNITNNDLLSLFDHHLDAIVAAIEKAPFVELAPDRLIVRDR